MNVSNQGMDFVAGCIGECEADGYQQHEEDEKYAPKDWTREGDTIYLRFEKHIYRVKITRVRNK